MPGVPPVLKPVDDEKPGTEGGGLPVQSYETLLGTTAVTEDREEVTPFPRGLHRLPEGDLFTVNITTATPEKLEDIYNVLETRIKGYGKITSVKGAGDNTVRLTVWAEPGNSFEESIGSLKTIELANGNIIEYQKEQKSVAVGLIAETLVTSDNAAASLPEITKETLLKVAAPSRPRRLLNGSLRDAENTLIRVTYENPKGLECIVRAAQIMGGHIVGGTTAGSVTILCVGEKTLARAAEIGEKITRELPGKASVVITARPVSIVEINGAIAVMSTEAQTTMDTIERERPLRPGSIALDERSFTELTTNERLVAEIGITGQETGNGTRVVKNIERKNIPPAAKKVVGREEEMQHLTDFCDNAFDDDLYPRDRPVPTFALHGLPGIGKTTLLAETMKQQTQKGRHVFYVTATPTHRLEPLWFIRRVVEQIAATQIGDRNQNIEKFLAGEKVENEELINALTEILFFTGKDNIIMLDNLEDADYESTIILAAFLRENKERFSRTSFMLAGRSGSDEKLADTIAHHFRGYNAIGLNPLKLTKKDVGPDAAETPHENCEALVRSTLEIPEGDEIAPELLLWIASESNGVPLFVVERCKMAREAGALHVSEGATGSRWILKPDATKDLDKMTVGQGISRSIIAAKITRLIEDAPALVKPFTTLIALGGGNEKLIQKLVEEGVLDADSIRGLQQRGIITSSIGGTIEFTHPLFVQDGEALIGTHVIQRAKRVLARQFNTWKERQIDLKSVGLDEAEIDVLIFNLADGARDSHLMKKYAPSAAERLYGNYTNIPCAKIALAGADLLKKEKPDVTLRLCFIAGDSYARANRNRDAQDILGKVWVAVIRQSPIPEIANEIISRLCDSAYVAADITNLEKWVNQWEQMVRNGLVAAPEKIALYKGCIASRKIYAANPREKEGHREAAIQIFKPLAESAQNPYVRAEAKRMMGMTNYDGVVFGGLDQETIEIAIPHDDELYEEMDNVLKNFTEFETAATTTEDIPTAEKRIRLPGTLFRMAYIYLWKDDTEKAELYAKKAHYEAARVNMPLLMAKAANVLGTIYAKKGNIASAQRVFEQAKEAAEITDAARGEYPSICENLGKLLLQSGNAERALMFGVEAFRAYVIEELGDKEILVEGNTPEEKDVSISRQLETHGDRLSDVIPPRDAVFYALPVICAAVKSQPALGERLPSYIKNARTKGESILTATMTAVTTSRLNEQAQRKALKRLRTKKDDLEILAA